MTLSLVAAILRSGDPNIEVTFLYSLDPSTNLPTVRLSTYDVRDGYGIVVEHTQLTAEVAFIGAVNKLNKRLDIADQLSLNPT